MSTTTILRLLQVIKRTGLSRSSIYAFIEQGHFPRQINLLPRAVGWVEEDVKNWIVSKINQSQHTEKHKVGLK